MPATPARIAFVREQFRVVESTDTAIKTVYGETARDTGDAPIETFFDSVADAQTMADARLTLLKANRRRFKTTVSGAGLFVGALDFSQVIPTVALTDSERAITALSALITEATIDFGGERTTMTLWG